METTPIEMHGGHIIALTAILCTMGTFVIILLTAIVVPMWRRVRLASGELKLKQELVAAGYSADDIVRIVQASAGESSSAGKSVVAERRPLRDVALPATDAIRARY
jgi:hypothetical protein